ncbi:RloB family protein [Pseudonocardia alni]|uniref:RloB family protein n=1 Tax=Pseudonocardia alni TaxID=33907 RepID=UPI00280B249E|nr:RloB family protein [Pseudonocardia alni]
MSRSPRQRGRSHSLKRRVARRPELRTIVVFTEGKNSEPDYVNALKQLAHVRENVSLQIEIDPEHGVPLTLVKSAAIRRRDPEIDECWCLFDVEWPRNHPYLKQAIDFARAHGVSLAISNPCFEVWLILHHKEFSRWCDTAEAESHSRKLDGRQGKSLEDAGQYMESRKVAADRARRLEERHRNSGTAFPDNNPSSGMFRFLEALEGSSMQPSDED